MMGNKMFKKLVLAGGFVAASAASSCFAVLDTDAAAAVTSIGTFVTDILAAVWPVAGAVAVGAIGLKLFKKFTNRAS